MPKGIDTLTAKVHNALKKTGDTMIAGFLTLFQDPTDDLHAVTKRYVDNLVGSVGDTSKFLAIITQNGIGTTTSQLGLPSPSTSGAASAVTDDTGAYINYASTTTSGWSFGPASTQPRFLADTTYVIKTGTDISDYRLWVGLVAASISGGDVAAGGSNIIGFNFSTTLGPNWFVRCDRNAVDGTIIDSGVAVAADTRYVLRADGSTDGEVKFYINGTLVTTITSNIPLGSESMSLIATANSISGASRSIRIRRIQQSSF